jgi:hypothetical protein
MPTWTEEEYTQWVKEHGLTTKDPTPPPKKQKYNNHKTIVDGIYFDSQLEADKYSELKLSLHMGVIAGFCRQPEFILLEGLGLTKPETYRADFIVFNLDGAYEIIDTKGVQTEVFRIKAKQFKHKFPRLELKIEQGRGDG